MNEVFAWKSTTKNHIIIFSFHIPWCYRSICSNRNCLSNVTTSRHFLIFSAIWNRTLDHLDLYNLLEIRHVQLQYNKKQRLDSLAILRTCSSLSYFSPLPKLLEGDQPKRRPHCEPWSKSTAHDWTQSEYVRMWKVCRSLAERTSNEGETPKTDYSMLLLERFWLNTYSKT